MQVLFEIMVQIKQRRGIGVENPSPRSFSGGIHVAQCVAMGWLRLVGSLKLQVSFAKEPYKRDDILKKRPIILRSLLMVATPYVDLHTYPCLFMGYTYGCAYLKL